MLKELIKQLSEEQKSRKCWSCKAEITAALNLYHEVRGSDYRHGVSCHTKFWYSKHESELRERFCLTKPQEEV